MISSPKNPLVQRARKLSKRGLRDAAREFIAEGATSVEEAVAAGVPVKVVLWTEDGSGSFEGLLSKARVAGCDVFEVSSNVMRTISATTSPPGIISICGFIDKTAEALCMRRPRLAVVLAEVRDPGNAGTILRTCRAVGADAVFVGAGTVDIYNPKLVRASSGALFNLPIARDVDIPSILERLGDLGVKRVGADPRHGEVYDEVDMTRPVAMVLGNEAWGLSDEVGRLVDVRAHIPMAGTTESLNVAIAAAILLFEAARQRRKQQ